MIERIMTKYSKRLSSCGDQIQQRVINTAAHIVSAFWLGALFKEKRKTYSPPF